MPLPLFIKKVCSLNRHGVMLRDYPFYLCSEPSLCTDRKTALIKWKKFDWQIHASVHKWKPGRTAVFTRWGLRVTAYWHVSIGERRCSEVFTKQNSCFVPHACSFSHSALMSLPACLPDCWVRLFSSVQLIRRSFAEMKPTRHSAAGRFDCRLNANSPPGPQSPFVGWAGESEGGKATVEAVRLQSFILMAPKVY